VACQSFKHYRKEHGTDIVQLASESMTMIRDELGRTSRVLCLSAEQQHPLQWAHYADSHRGVCLHFRCDQGTVFGLARGVSYRDDRDPILFPLNRQSPSEIADKLSLVKAKYWEYENEYRIIAVEGIEWGASLEGPFLYFEPELLEGVTVGMRMDADRRFELLELVDKLRPGLPVWEASEDEERFWMKIERLN
jgi:hypothetical protein